MSDTVFQLRVNQRVTTPNGPGVIQGRMDGDGGQPIILVSHDPEDPQVAESVRENFLRGIWVLREYPLDQITPTK